MAWCRVIFKLKQNGISGNLLNFILSDFSGNWRQRVVLRGESHIDFCTHYAIMAQRTWSPICVISRFSTKPIVFQKNLTAFRIKKPNWIFEELSNFCLIVFLISFFPLLLWITAENRTKLKKLYIWNTKSGGTQHHKHTNCTWLFSSATAMLVIF